MSSSTNYWSKYCNWREELIQLPINSEMEITFYSKQVVQCIYHVCELTKHSLSGIDKVKKKEIKKKSGFMLKYLISFQN